MGASAKIEKHITWSCARLSFSLLLQDEHVDDATVINLLGHTTTKMVHSTYNRYRPKNQARTINLLPSSKKETDTQGMYGERTEDHPNYELAK